jgi:hypothetical protein
LRSLLSHCTRGFSFALSFRGVDLSGIGWIEWLGFQHVDTMAQPIIPARLLRLAEALVFVSPHPATWRLLPRFLQGM